MVPPETEEPLSPLPQLTAGAVLVISVALAAVELGRMGLLLHWPAFVAATVATAIFLPLHVWHLRYGLRGERPPNSTTTLAVIAAVHLVALLVVGPAWSTMLGALATSALVVLVPRWAFVAAGLCALGPILAWAMRPEVVADYEVTVAYLVYAVVFRSVMQFALVWLVANVRELERSRAELAAAARRRERDRLETEVRHMLEVRSAVIAEAGRAAQTALAGSADAAGLVAIDRVVALAREALADLRRLVSDALLGERADAAPCDRPPEAAPVTQIARAAWVPALAVHLLAFAILLLVALRSFGPGVSEVESASDVTGWASATDLGTPAIVIAWAVVVTLYGGIALNVAQGRHPRYARTRWLALTVVAVGLFPVVGPVWGGAVWFAGAAAAMVFGDQRLPVVIGIFALGHAAWDTSFYAGLPGSLPVEAVIWNLAYVLTTTGLAITGLFASTRLVAVLADLKSTRNAIAQRAAGSERQRMSGDVHDLLGHTLTAIALKADLARRVVGHDRKAAETELDDLVTLADEQVGELHAVAHDSRTVFFEAEAQNAISLLRVAGVEVEARLDPGPLDDAASATLGWAIREGATNVVRHSCASRCFISALRIDGRVRLELTNDGAAPPGPQSTGLRALAERVARHDGVAQAELLPGGRFRLVVELPQATPA
jgi:signal transduction histidine kinase